MDARTHTHKLPSTTSITNYFFNDDIPTHFHDKRTGALLKTFPWGQTDIEFNDRPSY